MRGSDDEAFCIDSPVLPDELDALPRIAEQAGFRVVGLLATHADWDHLLGRLAFPQASLGCGAATAERLAAEPGKAQRDLREWDAEHYVERPAPLTLPPPQPLPVPGDLEVGSQQLELHPAAGHTADGTAYWLAWAEVLVCGDYLSPVEIPMVSPGGALEEYASTLERLEPLAARAQTIVPGHGGPLPRDAAARLMTEDRAYLDALRDDGEAATLPPGRSGAAQRRIHAENVARH